MTRLVFFAPFLLLVFLGCSRERAVWIDTYRAGRVTEYPATTRAEVRFERVEYEALNGSASPAGFVEIGRSGRRSPLLRERPDGPDSVLRSQAAKIGAHLVRWAEVPVGSAVPGGARATVSASAGTRGSVPQPAPPPQAETHADYLAVFYRRAR